MTPLPLSRHSSRVSLSKARDEGTKAPKAEKSDDDRQNQQHDLGDDDRRFTTGGRQRIERGNLLKRLNDQHETVEIEKHHAADDEHGTPETREVILVKGKCRRD